MKAEYIQLIGLVSLVFNSALLYSFLKILPREYAIIITDDFLIDNSKYDSIGKINWKGISKIQRLKKRNIELFLDKNILRNKKRNWLKKFIAFMTNWNYKKSILISSALLDCSFEELFESIIDAHKDFQSK